MNKGTGDIGVRMYTDYTQALKDLQMFVGSAGKELASLPHYRAAGRRRGRRTDREGQDDGRIVRPA